MKKRLTFLFALLCVSVMGWATQYCGERLTLSGGATIQLSCEAVSEGNYRIIIDGENLNGLGGSFYNPGAVDLRTKITSSTSSRIVCDIASASAPSLYTPLYVLCPGEQNIGWPNDVEWATCDGGEPQPGGGETPEPTPNTHTAGGHTITLDASFVNDVYTLVISSEDDMTGLGGSFWNVNGVGTDMRSNSGTNSYAVSGDKKTITCQVQSNSAPNIYTPLYVLFPGEVNFGSITLNWEDRTPITSEYCNYQGSETLGGGTYITLTWETDLSGNVVITMGNGTGTSSCSFRNGGFEGGINAFVVSDDDFATTTPASDYFTVVQVYSGNTYTLTKIADLPANAKIKHIGSGHALAWVANGNNQYSFPDFIYTYGGTCNQLDAPTNVSIDANNVITFDAVSGADSYTAYVSLNGVQKYSQVVVSGDELTFVPFEDGAYGVTVVASGSGKTDSDPSAAFVWNLEAVEIVLGNSEYCERIMQTGTNTEAAFTWETDGSGNIVITIAETLGGAADAAHFRGNALALGNFKVGAGQAAGSNYFSHPGTTTSNQLVLTVTNAPALGEKIYYHGVVEYATSLDGNAWPTLDFEWTYGTVCAGKAVSAIPNNNTMGTAVVKQGNDEVTSVEEGTSVTFIATVADAELYRFINWTKGGVEVSTNTSYTTTITETTNLVANFDYIRNTYCHAEINSIQNKKLYLTLGSIGGGQYQIKFEGSAEAKLTALTNANYTVNWVTTAIEDGDKKMSGQDVPFNNARWNFSASGYGAATMTFGISEGKTWEDIYVWNHAIYFMTAEGEVGYTSFPDRYHIAWTETCADAEAPVFAKAEGAVLDANSVRLTIQASDNWDGMLTYTIARAGADPIISNHASGEEFTQDVTGLTTGTEYTFTVTVSDGVNNTNQNIVITPVGDDTKPVMGDASLASKTWNSAVINVAATDNIGVAAYYIVELDAEYVALEDKITIENLIQGTPYTFTIKAKDAAGNLSDNSSEVNFTTDSHLIAPTTAPVVPAWPAAQVMSIYSDAYTPNAAWGFLEGWGQSTTKTDMVIAENNVMKYSNFNYLGWQTAAPYNAMTMEKLHLDIWVADDCTIGIIPIYGGTSLTTDDSHRVKPTLIGQQWNSVDLDLATDYAGLNVSSIFQFKFDQGTTTEFFIDNVYFYRTTELVDDIAPTNVSGSVTSTSYYSVVLAVSATDDNDAVNYIIKNGDTQVASGSGASGATINIKVANLAAGTNYAFSLIAKDGNDNAAAPVIVNVSTLAAPAPAPVPTYNSGLVKSLYSDAYTPIVTVENYCEWWWESPTVHTNHTLGNGDHVLFYDNNHQAGASFGWAWNANNKIDFSGYQNLHLSVYPTTSGTIEIYPVIAPEGEFHMVSQTLTAGEWNEIELDYSAKTFAPLNQIGFINFYGLGEFFIDNVYFWSYGVATNQDNWSTFACVQKMQVPSGITAYKAAYSNEGGDEVLTLTALSDGIIPSNVGVLLKSQTPSTAYAFTATDATPATDMSDNSLVGCVTRTDISDVAATNDIFCLRRSDMFDMSGFFLYTGQFIPAGKAYLPVPKEDATPAPSRRIRFVYDTTTALDNVESSAMLGGQKILRNGQLLIRRGDAVYTIQGVRVE